MERFLVPVFLKRMNFSPALESVLSLLVMAASVVPQDDFLIAVWSIQAMNVSVCLTQSSTDPN
jgi:DNA-binding winged helix-turn-helix (wHTH) protein